MLSTYLRDAIIDHFLRDGLFLSLHTRDPGATGVSELSGYERVPAGRLTDSKDGFTATTSDVVFRDLPSCTVGWVGIWDAKSGGRYLLGGAMGVPKVVIEGDSIRFASGKLAFALDA